jgi:hypothetical protein
MENPIKTPLMPEAATSVATWSTEQMMLEMVHDRVATGVTRVVWAAAVLRCGKQMEKLAHYYFSWIVSSRNRDKYEMLPLGLKFKEETSKVLHLEHSFVWCWNLDTSESRSEIPGKFLNVVLEKNGDQLDGSCEKWRSITQSRGEEYPTYNKNN